MFLCFVVLIRLARAGPRSEPTQYETVSFNGSFRRADAAPRGLRNNNYPSGLQMLRRPRCGRDDSIPLHSIGGNDIVSNKKQTRTLLTSNEMNFFPFFIHIFK